VFKTPFNSRKMPTKIVYYKQKVIIYKVFYLLILTDGEEKETLKIKIIKITFTTSTIKERFLWNL